MPGVFLSYRRADSASWVERLHGHLLTRFGDSFVFQDVEDIRPGERWLDVVIEEIASCEAFLLAIGPHWLDARDDAGRRRIALDSDVHNREIVCAIDRGRTIIPVLVGGATMPPASNLPLSIRPLTAWHAAILRADDEHWPEDVRTLIDRLREIFSASREPLDLDGVLSTLMEMIDRGQATLQRLADVAETIELMHRAAAILDQVLPLYPNHPELKAARGEVYANQSQALQKLGDQPGSERAIEKAALVFDANRVEDPGDPAAWLGLARIAEWRGDTEQALDLFAKVIDLNPACDSAVKARERISKDLGPAGSARGDKETPFEKVTVSTGPCTATPCEDPPLCAQPEECRLVPCVGGACKVVGKCGPVGRCSPVGRCGIVGECRLVGAPPNAWMKHAWMKHAWMKHAWMKHAWILHDHSTGVQHGRLEHSEIAFHREIQHGEIHHIVGPGQSAI